MKRFVSLVLALMLCAGFAVPALAAEFTDVPTDHPFYDAIRAATEKGIVGGYPDGTFKPTNTVTKNHFCAMLARAFFPETIVLYDTDQYRALGSFAPTSYALAHNDILNGTSFHWYFTDSSVMTGGINRYDMAQLMSNILKDKGLMADASQKSAAQTRIADYNAIPDQYKDAVAAVYALGIIGGFSNGTFGGSGTMTRGQAAVVIYRLAQYVGDGSGTEPETSVDTDPTTGQEDPAGPGSSETVPETPATPELPETPVTPADRTLSNGKAITEDNVTEILNQLKAKYNKRDGGNNDFSKGYGGLGSGRTPSKNCISEIISQYKHYQSHGSISTTAGCGGWAAFVADEVFGQTGVTWKKAGIANAKPGDLMVILDDAGYVTHICIYVSEANGFPKTKKVYTTDATQNNGVYTISWSNNSRPSTNDIDVWTAYPN